MDRGTGGQGYRYTRRQVGRWGGEWDIFLMRENLANPISADSEPYGAEIRTC